MTEDERLLTAADFAQLAKVTVRAVRRWAARGVGPKPIKPPGSRIVRYRQSEVDAWLDCSHVSAAGEAQ